MITNEKYFFKNQSSASLSGPLYNVNDGTLILQVDGNVSNLELSVLGNTDLVDDDFVTLKTINASDYNMSDKITSTGIYWVDINGLRKIKLNLSKITGSVSVKAITKRGLTTDLVARAMAANAAGGGSYTLPVASASTLGGVKVGENLTIEEDGTLNASGGTNNKIPSFFIDIPSQPLNESNTGIKYTLPTSFNEKLTTNLNNILDIYQTFSIQFLINNVLVTFNPSYSTDTYGYGTRRFNSTSKPTSINLFANIVNNKYDISTSADPVMYGGFLPVTLELTLTWDNTTPSVTKGVYKLYGYSSQIPSIQYIQKNLLTKTNNTSYTPTKDYNPATKKYVDDAVASAGGGDNIYKMYISIYSYTLLSADANSSSIFLTSYADKFTEFINSIGDGNGALLYLYGSLNAATQSYYMVPQGYMFTLASEGKSIVNQTTIKFVSSYVVTDAITKLDNRAAAKIYTLTINGTWTDNVFTCTSAAIYISTRFLLPTNNTTSYTPTSDYNPATKKYVDDTITAAITTSLEGSY